jgi:hypothetical protein
MQVGAMLILSWVFLFGSARSYETLSTLADDSRVVSTTVCSILQNPRFFSGKTVRFQSNVEMGFETFIANDPSCTKGVWLDYPDEAQSDSRKGRKVVLITDRELEKFKQVTGAKAEESPEFQCKSMHCMRYYVSATLTGRLDYRPVRCRKTRATGNSNPFQCGYGHMGAWDVRLVIQSVSDVTALPRHY